MPTNEEAFSMLMVLGECLTNFRAAERLYAQRYPDRQYQSYKCFERLANRVRTTGNVQPSKKRQRDATVKGERSADILAAVSVDPQVSTRRLERDSGVSRSTISRILRTNNFHPYHISLHQELEANDHLHRTNFVLWAQDMIRNDPNFHHNVLWCDEATLKNNGDVNRHNMHYWSQENQHWIREVNNQRQWTLNTWCGIFDGKILGPYFFEERLTGELYNNFLQDEFLVFLNDIPIERQLEMWFMQDGCPAHYHIDVRTTLTAMFGEQWIARGGPVPWPPRSPDITVMDYYLWGRIKDIVYQVAPTTREDMKNRIREACTQIRRDEVIRALDSFPSRLDMCLAVGGGLFEHFMP